jgi:hypothetical protein
VTSGGRHDLRGGGPAEPPGGDDLVDLLYGELSADEERAVRARVAGDPELSAQLASLERVREFTRSVADEEPSPGISARLLAEAAQVASRRRSAAPGEPAVGWLARVRSWLQPLIAHPALTAATSVLFVAGVASLLLLRGGGTLTATAPSPEFAEPGGAATGNADRIGPERTVAPEQPEAAAPPATTAPSGSAAGEGGGAGAGDLAGTDDLARSGSDQAASRRPAVAAKPRPQRSPEKKAAEAEDAPAGRVAKNKTGDRGVLGLAEEKPAAPRADKEAAPNEKASGPPADEGAEASPSSPPAAQPAAPPPATQTPQDTDAVLSARDLHERAIKAASSRRCLEVQQLDQSIRKLDPAYHEKFVLRDKRLAVCLSGAKAGKARR